MVELRDVHMQFEQKQVLEGVSLDVQPQERLVIMGQSGSGKSTILRLILGILRPDSGSVFFKQFEINRLKRRKLQQVRQHIGMVYQYSALLSSLTVRENVALPLEELTDKSRSEIDKIVDEKLELVGMLDTKDLLPDELSGGMRKRVALARGLVLEPRVDPAGRAFSRTRPGHCHGCRRIDYQPHSENEGDLHHGDTRNGERLSHRHADGYAVRGKNY